LRSSGNQDGQARKRANSLDGFSLMLRALEFSGRWERILSDLSLRVPRTLAHVVSIEDLIQDVSLRVWQNWGVVRTLNEHQQVWWVKKTARRHLLWLSRRQGIHQRAIERVGHDGDGGREVDPSGVAPSDSQQHLITRLKQGLDALAPMRRDVIQCIFFQGLSPKQTAQKLRTSNGSVRKLKHMALGLLREMLLRTDPGGVS
jgi:RNA polymerase sigma factor (sigma-70 family)